MPHLVDPALPPGALSRRPQPHLIGDGGKVRVGLRPWREADAGSLAQAYRDPAIQRWHGRTLDRTEARQLIFEWNRAWLTESGASWAVVDPDDGRLLGRVGFREVILADGFGEVAYWVVPELRGLGVAHAAVDTLTRWAFDEIGLHRLEILHSVLNQASCAVAVAAGFEFEGTARSSVLHADGWHDMHVHALIGPP